MGRKKLKVYTAHVDYEDGDGDTLRSATYKFSAPSFRAAKVKATNAAADNLEPEPEEGFTITSIHQVKEPVKKSKLKRLS